MIQLPLELRLLAAVLLVVGIVFGIHLLIKREQDQAVAVKEAQYAEAAASASEAARAEEARVRADQTENANETQRIAARDRAALAAASDRAAASALRVHADVAARSGQAPGDTEAAQQCAADRDALAVVLDQSLDEYRSLAHDADEALADSRRRGIECQRDYDALTPH